MSLSEWFSLIFIIALVAILMWAGLDNQNKIRTAPCSQFQNEITKYLPARCLKYYSK